MRYYHHITRCLTIIGLTVLTLGFICCREKTSTPNTTPREDYDTVLVERGAQDARDALAFPAGSQDREFAILAIRAAEERLRHAGMNKSADSYIAGAAQYLDTLSHD